MPSVNISSYTDAHNISLIPDTLLSDDVTNAVVFSKGTSDPALYQFNLKSQASFNICASVSANSFEGDLLGEMCDQSGEVISKIVFDRKRKIVYIPFDLNEPIENMLFERYAEKKQLPKKLSKIYYILKPLIGDRGKILIRRFFSKTRSRPAFPDWPIESALTDYINFLTNLMVKVSREGKIPCIGFWPKGHDFCCVLTHDVETALGIKNIENLLKIEEESGVRSVINIVPEKYETDERAIEDWKKRGHEIGVHGLKHDGQLFSNESTFKERSEKINKKIREWGANGFRSPALYRNPDWLKYLEVEFDSSFPDTDPYTPQSGGCLNILPYFIGDTVEIPVTLPQDYTLYNVLGLGTEEANRVWREKIEHIEKNRGCAVLITHPDRHYTDSEDRIKNYRRIISTIKRKKCWIALASHVSVWWRKRANAFIEADGELFYLKEGSEDMEILMLK